VQNLNTPQNNSASWDLQMGFNSAFKGLICTKADDHTDSHSYFIILQGVMGLKLEWELQFTAVCYL